MTRHEYQEELYRLRATVLEELDVVTRQLAHVVAAVEGSDAGVCEAVVAGDDDVDRLYRHVQSELATVIARQAPVASDLRLILALLHISRLVERIGDQCVNVAKLVALAGTPPPGAESFHASLVAMSRAAEQEVRGATAALRDDDLAAARAVAKRDEVVDDLNRACFHQAIEFGDRTDRRSWATAMILAARAFERMADNAVDIGSHLRFALTGSFEAPDAAPAS